MKYLFYFVITVICLDQTYAQIAAIQIDNENTLWLGIDNAVTVAVEGYSCNSIFLTTDNGTITGEKGHYIIRPDKPTTK